MKRGPMFNPNWPLADQIHDPAHDGWRKCLVHLPGVVHRAICVCAPDIQCERCAEIDRYVQSLADYIEERMK